MSNYRKLRATFNFQEWLDSRYMSIEALEDNLTVSFSENVIYYSTDQTKTWTALPPDTTTPAINTGDRIYFKTENLDPNNSVGIGTFTISKRCKACGNAISLTNGQIQWFQFYKLFYNCTTLVEVSENFLPATTLGYSCYSGMFYGCTSLVNAPQLPATTLSIQCYQYMFRDCTSLVEAPVLPATTLSTECYSNMFRGCTSLVNAPELPATLATYCYYNMFKDCTSLVNAPELPATTLADNCYEGMFYGCTSLVEAPELPATTLVNSCYYGMFYNCSSLNYIYAKFTTTPNSSYTSNWVYGVASSGTFIKNVNATWNVTGVNGVPSGWTIKKDNEFAKLTTCTELTITKAYDVIGNDTITFVEYTATGTGVDYNGNTIEGTYTVTGTAYSDPFTQNTSSESITKTIYFTYCGMTASTTITQGPWQDPDTTFVYIDALEDGLTIGYTNTLKYQIRGESQWRVLEGKTVPINTGERIYVQGQWLDGYSGSTGVGTFTFNKKCKVGGNSYSLVNVFNNSLNSYQFSKLFYNCTTLVEVSSNFLPATTLATNCYSNMFQNCTSLTQAPELPATRLADFCYSCMFQDCTSLVEAPVLPATTLATNCYRYMFYGCTSLVNAPKLPATTLANQCYQYMFQGCISLVQAPELPATILADYCYREMFYGCTSLVNAPVLPATTLANSCYYSMFLNCTSLVNAPELPATTLTNQCYQGMFQNCTSLTQAPELPATTLVYGCYSNMFQNCKALVNAPILPAITLNTYCYERMLDGCTSLTQAPVLPATTLANQCYYQMFAGCTSLIQAPALPATTLATNCYYQMFAGCTSLIQAPELPATTLVSGCYQKMFQNCSKLNYIYAKFTTTPNSSYTSNWVSGVASTGTFVKNYEATWDITGTHGVPSGWIVEKDITIQSCTQLSIIADDVNGRATTTNIYYTATCLATNYRGETITVTIQDTVTSEEFPQNTSTTDVIERTVSYTYMGQTATTTITQGVWVDQFYSLNLNDQWQSSSIVNPDPSLYDGVYESFSNKGINNSAAIAYITINGYSNFKFYIRSYAESNYDYVMVSQLDQVISYSTSYNSTSLIKAHTRGKQNSGTALAYYTLVEFTGIDEGQHVITVLYRKDSSTNSGYDCGYLLIPKNQ